MKKLILFLFLILLIPLSQACLDITLAKSSYLSGETFQAEITGSLIEKLTYSDFSFFYNGREYFPAVTLQQLASNKWIVFGDLPEKYGINEFSVDNVVCKENDSLKEVSQKASFTIKKPLQSYYSDLIDKVRGKWSSLDADEISQAVIALSDFSESKNGQSELLKKGAECWPSGNCTVKSTSLAILALNDTENAKNWLLDSQNSINTGIWNLITESDSAKECILTINSKASNVSIPAGANEMPLSLPDDEMINVSLDCSVNAKISHTYLGTVHEFNLGTINNRKCWGKSYRSDCNALSTAYALRIIRDSKAEQWLSANAKSTEGIAYSYIYSGNSDSKEWLVNNQHPSGYWSNSSLALSNKSDVYSTAAAAKALGSVKAENWLRDNLDSFTLEEKALALQLFKNKIEPLVSIQNGYVKENSLQNITLKISNKGILATEIKISLMSSEKTLSLQPKTAQSVSIPIPQVQDLTFSSIDIISRIGTEERGYSIPAIILPAGKTEEEVNLINQTLPPETGALKTANFEFLEKEINETIAVGETRAMNISVKNLGAEQITLDVTIWGLSVIESIPVSVDLSPNSISVIPVVFKLSDMNDYAGQITLEYKGNSKSIPVYISAKPPEVSEESCSELNGTICLTTCEGTVKSTAEGSCCIGTCSKAEGKKSIISMKTLGIAMIVLAVLIAAFFLFLKLRKPKRRSLEKVLEKIKEESKIHEFEEPKKPEEKI